MDLGSQASGGAPNSGGNVFVQIIPSLASAFGGPAVGSRLLNISLRERGYNAVLVSARYNDPGGSKMSDGEQTEILSSTACINLFPRARPFFLQNSWGILCFLLRNRHKIRVIHMHGMYLLPYIYGYAVARIWNIPYGIQPHGSLEPYQRSKSRVKKAIYDLFIGRSILRNSRYFIFASASEAEGAVEVVGRDRSSVAPLGVRLESPSASAQIRDKFPSIDRDKAVLYLGRLARKKRPDRLLEAWARAQKPDGAHLFIVGPDGDFSAAELLILAERLGVRSSVTFLGPLRGGERTWVYDRCGVYVLPSESENFGITVAEAMYSGCFVITTNSVASGEHVAASGGGLVVEQGTQALAEALTEALYGADQRLRGQRASEYARQHLAWSRMSGALAAEWETVAKR
ncbi:glycosyltransferase [Pseudonocardia terrae]|uniref:glycosyltransferase n=1 Tax=Pseudonocardia terrae TaxID=2905831 RepID=UPI0035587C8A